MEYMEYIRLITSQVDVLVIGAIGVVAFACVSTIGDDYPQTQKLVGLVMTIGLGAAWGYYLAVEQKYGFGSWVLKGMMVNGGCAYLGLQVVDVAFPNVMARIANLIPTILGHSGKVEDRVKKTNGDSGLNG